jgi:ABC-2 type transport system ATP-binding protein
MTIQVQDVWKKYGEVEALRGLSLQVEPGTIYGLLGANGAGKSTLIKILVGITRPTSGTVSVLGLNPTSHARQIRKQVGYMPQAPALYEDLSPRDNIRFFARAHHLDKLEQRIDAVLDFTDLRARQHDPVFGFSGGMKQRVSLACALIHEPKLLLLDEPSAGVDPKLRETFWQHFRDLAAQGVTILVSTHQMDEVMHCDRAAVMRAGEILASDTPHGLLARGKATVTLWRHNADSETRTVEQPATALPAMLGIDDVYQKIDVRPATLEDVVLDLIKERN